MQLDVIGLFFAQRHADMRQIGDTAGQRLPVGLYLGQLTLGTIQTITQVAHFIQQRLNIFSSRFGLADRFGARIALVLQRFGLGLQFTAPGFKSLKPLGIENEASCGQSLGDHVKVAAQQFGIEHGIRSVAVGD